MSDLLITINANSKGVTEEYEKISKQTDALQDNLNNIAKVSGIAFTALAAQVGIALKAYEGADSASRALTASLQTQGIFTEELKDQYVEYAENVQRLTGFEAEEIIKSQAVAQSFLHQIPITQELTTAIADLAQQQGISLPAAAEELGKAIGNGTGGLVRQGLKFAEAATEAQRYAQTLEFVQAKAGGMAEAQNQGLGSLRGLQAAIHDTQIELGERFAPAATAVIKALTSFLSTSKEASTAFTDFKAGLIVVGLVLTGLGVVLPLIANGFLAVRAAVIALNLQLTATKLLLYGLGIGLVIALLVELALHWETVSKRVILAVKGMVEFVSGAFAGLGKVLNGAFHLDADKIKEGLNDIVAAFKSGINTATSEIPAKTEETLQTQDEIKAKYAEKDRVRREQQENAKVELQKAENELVELELNNASAKQITLKKAEIETLKALEKNQNVTQRELLQQRHDQILQQEKVFGAAYTTIAKTVNSSQVQSTKEASGELVALTQSKNETLKAIGKAASVTQITIKTAESAMNIYAGFSAIPFIGQILGIAGAAAAIAFGAEQVGTVLSAAQGGLVTGGIAGRDSVPAFLMPGELVVPTKNFDEVIDSVSKARTGAASSASEAAFAHVEFSFKGNLMDFIETKLVERKRLNISVQRS